MKDRIIFIGILLIAVILVCSISIITDSRNPQERAVMINNHELNGFDAKIGGTVVIKYSSTKYLNDCIADMESRGYVVKQLEEKSGTLNNLTVVVYERRK